MNSDGTTSPNGQTFLTLDLVCTRCHGTMMNIQQLSNAAKYIHQAPSMLTLTANGSTSLAIVKKGAPVTVQFSLKPGSKTGMNAAFWVMCQGPRGWTSFNGMKWVPGQVPWFKSTPMVNLNNIVLQQGSLSVLGEYTYWVAIYPADGTSVVSTVPVMVTK